MEVAVLSFDDALDRARELYPDYHIVSASETPTLWVFGWAPADWAEEIGCGPITVSKDGGETRMQGSLWPVQNSEPVTEVPWVGDQPTEAELAAAEERYGKALEDPEKGLLHMPDGHYELALADGYDADDPYAQATLIQAARHADTPQVLAGFTWLRLSAMWQVAAASVSLTITRDDGVVVLLLEPGIGGSTEYRLTPERSKRLVDGLVASGVGQLHGSYPKNPCTIICDGGYWDLDYTDDRQHGFASGNAVWPWELDFMCRALATAGLPMLFGDGCLRYEEPAPDLPRRRAIRSSWKTHRMPRTHKTIPLDMTLTQGEFERLAWGVVPEDMDHRWFVYFDGEAFCFHRSWTGFLIYRVLVRDARDGSGYELYEAVVNASPKQYTPADDREEVRRLRELLHAALDGEL